MKWRTPRGPQLRHCVKVALAAVAAYILTLGERNEYALFSMLGAALVVGGSVGEDLNTSLNRVRGTLAGTVVGITVAYLLGKSIVSLGLSLALLTWVSLGLGWGIPATRVGIAMALVVWFAHTSDATHYAIWRLLNTLIGVSVGFAVSRLVWPIRGRNEIANALDRVLKATRTLLDALASGAPSDALLPLQVGVLDAVAAVRSARKNAHLERRIDRTTDLLHTHTVPAVRAAILTLGVSITLEELVHADVRRECLDAVRQATAALAAEAQDLQAEQPFDEFTPRYESAMREGAHPDVDADMRTLLVGLLSELQRIHVALRAIRDARVTTSPAV